MRIIHHRTCQSHDVGITVANNGVCLLRAGNQADCPGADAACGTNGTGQMHLLFRESVRLVDEPKVVLMGVMPFSFDRAVLRVRSYQKPVFGVDGDGELRITNLPIEPNPQRYYRRITVGPSLRY